MHQGFAMMVLHALVPCKTLRVPAQLVQIRFIAFARRRLRGAGIARVPVRQMPIVIRVGSVQVLHNRTASGLPRVPSRRALRRQTARPLTPTTAKCPWRKRVSWLDVRQRLTIAAADSRVAI